MAKHFEGTASVHGAVVCVPACPLDDRAVPERDFLTGEVLTGSYQLPGAGVQGDLSSSSIRFMLCASKSAQLLHWWVSSCLLVLLFKYLFCW